MPDQISILWCGNLSTQEHEDIFRNLLNQVKFLLHITTTATNFKVTNIVSEILRMYCELGFIIALLFIQAGTMNSVFIARDELGATRLAFIINSNATYVAYALVLFQGTSLFASQVVILRRPSDEPPISPRHYRGIPTYTANLRHSTWEGIDPESSIPHINNGQRCSLNGPDLDDDRSEENVTNKQSECEQNLSYGTSSDNGQMMNCLTDQTRYNQSLSHSTNIQDTRAPNSQNEHIIEMSSTEHNGSQSEEINISESNVSASQGALNLSFEHSNYRRWCRDERRRCRDERRLQRRYANRYQQDEQLMQYLSAKRQLRGERRMQITLERRRQRDERRWQRRERRRLRAERQQRNVSAQTSHDGQNGRDHFHTSF